MIFQNFINYNNAFRICAEGIIKFRSSLFKGLQRFGTESQGLKIRRMQHYAALCRKDNNAQDCIFKIFYAETVHLPKSLLECAFS
jgi:hypothetical protein